MLQYIRGKDNVKADLLSRNRVANPHQPDSSFDEKIFASVIDNSLFVKQLSQEQDADPIIHKAKTLIQNGHCIVEGRLKRIQNKLRIENDILTKSGRPIISASVRKFVVNEVHSSVHYGTDKTYALLKDRFFGLVCTVMF